MEFNMSIIYNLNVNYEGIYREALMFATEENLIK